MGVRAFVALELPDDARERIAALPATLKPKLPGLRWISPETLHLTLRFLGDSTPEALDALTPLLADAAARCASADLAVAGLGTFPERGRPRVLWLGFDLPDEVRALQRACEEAAVALGFPPEGKAFRPHLTLGRWREGGPRRLDLPALALGTVRLQSLVLYESQLRPSGAVHTARATFPLGVGPGLAVDSRPEAP